MNLLVNPVITDFQQDVDGTIKKLKLGQEKEDAYANIIGQAESADLENNKAATINVSTYTEPVEITPTSGKDGMKKATVTLSNIPSPSGSGTLYAWYTGSEFAYTTTATPSVGDFAIGIFVEYTTQFGVSSVSEVTEEGIKITDVSGGDVFERASTYDITLE